MLPGAISAGTRGPSPMKTPVPGRKSSYRQRIEQLERCSNGSWLTQGQKCRSHWVAVHPNQLGCISPEPVGPAATGRLRAMFSAMQMTSLVTRRRCLLTCSTGVRPCSANVLKGRHMQMTSLVTRLWCVLTDATGERRRTANVLGALRMRLAERQMGPLWQSARPPRCRMRAMRLFILGGVSIAPRLVRSLRLAAGA